MSTFRTRKDLEGRLESFWSNAHTTLLIVHCQWPEDDEHYLLCKLLMDSTAKEKSKHTSFRKHMILIVHINKNESKSSVPMCSFLWGWKIIAVESLNISPGFPGVPQFLNFNVSNILTAPLQGFKNSLIKQLVIDLFPQAFSCITYQPSDLRDMHDIAALIDIARKNEYFVQMCSNYILQENFSTQKFLAIDSIHGVPKWLLQIATSEQQITRYLTFIDAIYGFFEDIILHSLSTIVFALESYSGWPDFNNFGTLPCEPKDKEWEERLCYVMKYLNTSFICTEPVMQSQIPFSRFLMDKFGHYKKTYLDECIELEQSSEINSSICSSAMVLDAKNLNSLNKKYQSIFSSFLLTESFWHSVSSYREFYLYDFCILTLQKRLRYLDDKEIIAWMMYLLKGKLLYMSIELSEEQFPSIIHFITWLHEDFFHNCLELITTLKKLKCLLPINFEEVQNDSFWNNWFQKSQVSNKNDLSNTAHELTIVENLSNFIVDDAAKSLNDEHHYLECIENAECRQGFAKLPEEGRKKLVSAAVEKNDYSQNYECDATCNISEFNEITPEDAVLAEKYSKLMQNDFVLPKTDALSDQVKVMKHQNIVENSESDCISANKLSQDKKDSFLHTASVENNELMENSNCENSSNFKFSQNEKDSPLQNASLEHTRLMKHQNIEENSNSDSSSDNETNDQLDFDNFEFEDNENIANKTTLADDGEMQMDMYNDDTHPKPTYLYMATEITNQNTINNRAFEHSLQSKFDTIIGHLDQNTSDNKYLDNCDDTNKVNPSNKKCSMLGNEENNDNKHVTSPISYEVNHDEQENICNLKHYSESGPSLDSDATDEKLNNSNFYEFPDFSKAFLFKVLLPIINPSNLKSLNAGRIVCLARAAAVRVNDEFAMLDFLDIIRNILSLNNGNGQFLAKNNLIKDFVSSFEQSGYTLTSDDCLQALHVLLTYLYSVTDQRHQLRVTLLIFLRVLESDDDMPNLQNIVHICLQLVCQLKNVTFFRPILQRIIRSYDLTEEENDFDSFGEAGQRLHEMLYNNLSNIYEDMASVTEIEHMIDHCHDNIKSQIWMLILQIMNIKSFTTITNKTLRQSLLTSAHEPLLAAFQKALQIIKDAGPVNLQRIVAARYIRAFFDALTPCLCDIKKLEDDQYDWLLDHLSNLFSPFIGVDGPEGKIKAIIILYLLKVLRHQLTWKEWRYVYELLRKKMRCISVLPETDKSYSLVQWYPLCPSENFACFVNSHYNNILNYASGEKDCTLSTICHNSFQNLFDLMLTCRLTLQSDNNSSKVLQAIMESYPKSNHFKTLLIESICKLSFNSAILNITADMSNNDLLKALIALEVAKFCILQQESNDFVDDCFFDKCMREEIPLLEDLVKPHESCHFYNCACNYRIGFDVNVITANCALCNQKMIKSNLTTINAANNIGIMSVQITMKILNFFSCSMLLVFSSLKSNSASQANLPFIEERFQAAWSDLIKSFPENEEFVCKLLYLVIAQTLTLTCEQEYPTEKSNRSDWLKSFHSACQQLILYRHSSIQSAEVKRCMIMAELKKEFWEEKLHEIDFLMARVTDAYEDSCALFFSLQAYPSEQHFELSYKLSENGEWPFLTLFFDWKDKLALIKCLLSIWRWHVSICSTVNYQYSRKEIKDLTVHDVINKYEHLASPLKTMSDDIQKLFNATFITAEEFTIVDDKSFIIDLLIIDSSSKLLTILTRLVNIQNDFLDQVAYLATAKDCFCLEYIKWNKDTSMIPVMHISRLNKSAVIDYEWSDDYLDFAQNNTSYGLGFDIFYDYETIEARLARELLFGKSHIVTELSMTQFHFRDEISMSGRTLITDVESLIKQCPLSLNQKERMNKETSSQLRQYFSMTLQVAWMLKLTGGSEENVLCSYIQTWKNAMPRSVAKDCQRLDNSLQLQHVASFYQQLELLLAKKNMFEGDVHPFKISLGALQKPTADTLRQPGVPLKDISDVLLRLLFRITCNKVVVNVKDQLKEYLCDVTLWEYGFSVEAKMNSINKLDANYYPCYYLAVYLVIYVNIISIQKIIVHSKPTCH